MTHPWADDAALFALARAELFTAVLGDVMDTLALHHQFLPPTIRPLRDDMVVVGRAMTVLEADLDTLPVEPLAQPFGLMFHALDDLKPGEVYLCTGAAPRYALWGELMSTRARHLGAAGAVLDGYARDTRGILTLDFPTFAYGSYGQDQGPRGQVVDFRIPITIGNVAITSGDLVYGDRDGVCVVPQAAEVEVVRLALEKVRGEHLVRNAIRAGMSTVDAFARYHIM